MEIARRLVVLCALICLLNSVAFAQGAKVTTENRPATESERDNPTERARWFLRGRTVNGRPAPELLERAHQQKMNKRAPQRTPALTSNSGSSGAARTGAQSVVTSESSSAAATSAIKPTVIQTTGGPAWTPLGPAPSGTAAPGDNNQDYGPAVGRSTVVVVDQSDATGNTVYLGGASGGLWKSTDAANPTLSSVHWTPLTDGEATLTVGAMAIQPGNPNWLVVGTGEANNSADSYYGLGFLISRDGGNTWTSVSTANGGAIDLHGLGTTRIAFSTDNPSLVVATMAAASGGITVGAEFGGTPARGIYFSTDAGLHWQRATVTDLGGATPDAGSANDVIYNPSTHRFYANLRYHGFYSSADGQNWTRLPNQPGGATLDLDGLCPAALPSPVTCPLYRAVMTIVPRRNEMYVWIVDTTDVNKGIYQTTDGGNTWTTLDISGINNCGDGAGGACGTAQGTYNLTLAGVPNGSGTDVYAGAVNQYRCSLTASNPTCSSPGFANLTHVYHDCGGGVGAFAHVHPDQHGIDFLSSNPDIIYFANDGGVYRTLSGFAGATRNCIGGNAPQPQPWLQFDNLSGTMGSMIQYVWFSQHPTDATVMLGGTQDNGSMAKNSLVAVSAAGFGYTWQSVNNGDGGWNDINPTDPNEWFTSNPRLSSGGGVQQCTNTQQPNQPFQITCGASGFQSVITSSTVGGDAAPFYTTYMLDPQAASHMLVGTCRLWRVDRPGSGSTSWAAPVSGAQTWHLDQFATQGTSACASTALNMVTAIAAGGPCNGTCNPGANPGAASGNGSQVVYVGTDAGKVFVTTNADGGPGTWFDRSVGLNNVNNTGRPGCNLAANPFSCGYPISGIAVDPHFPNGNVAYVTIMGFKTGHVFKTTDAGATWTPLDGVSTGTGLPDNPADAVVVDPVKANTVYVATDVGVFTSTGDGNWTEVGPSSGNGTLPDVAVTALHIFNNNNDVRLRASTYGRGIWEITLTGFSLSVSNPTLYAFPTQTATFNATVSGAFNYSSAINLSCQAGSTAAPPTCDPNPASVTVPGSSQSVAINASAPAVGDFSFKVTAAGTDPQQLTQSVPVILHVADFDVTGLPASFSVGHGDTANLPFTINPVGAFLGTVALTCSGLPAGTSCTFNPATVSLAPGQPVTVALGISTSPTLTTGAYNISVVGTGTLSSGSLPHVQTLALTVLSSWFQVLTVSPANLGTVKPGQPLAANVTVQSNGGYAGTLTMSCSFLAGFGARGASTCNFPNFPEPPSVSVQAGDVKQVAVGINTTGGVAGNPHIEVTAADAAAPPSTSSTVGFNYSVIDYALTVASPANLVPGGSTVMNAGIASLNGYPDVQPGTVEVTCTVPSPLTCTLAPASPYTLTASVSTVPFTVTVAAPPSAPANTYAVTLDSKDTAFPSLVHSQSRSVAVQDFQVSATPAAGVIKAGDKTTHTISIAGLGGFNGTVNFTASQCPALTTCTFDRTSASAGSAVTLTIQTTAPSVAEMKPLDRRSTPLWAFWLSMPGALGVVLLNREARRRKLVGGVLLGMGLLLALAACGGGGGGTTTPPPVPKPGTPAGTYTITVTGTSGSGSSLLTHSTQITLTVQ